MLGGLPIGGHGIQREGEEDHAAGAVHADARVAHAAGLAGNRLEEDGRGIGGGREGVGEVRADRAEVRQKSKLGYRL